MNAPRYKIVENTADFIILRNVGPWEKYPTITNNPEAVLEALADSLRGRRLFYFDSEGELTEIDHEDGELKGFGLLRGQTAPEATGDPEEDPAKPEAEEEED